jgi:hypothetical protein
LKISSIKGVEMSDVVELDEFDWGFTLVTEDELEAVQEAESKVTSTSSSLEALQTKLDTLYNAVQPLLNNLKSNPEKEYILWPGRVEKVEAFQLKLKSLYEN